MDLYSGNVCVCKSVYTLHEFLMELLCVPTWSLFTSEVVRSDHGNFL